MLSLFIFNFQAAGAFDTASVSASAVAAGSVASGLAASLSGIQKGLVPLTYTDNFMCTKRSCTNPIFPGLQEFGHSVLEAQETKTWTCVNHTASTAWPDAGFCGKVVAGYPFALAAPSDASAPHDLRERLALAGQAAASAYVAHLAGMGHDFWDHTKPWEHDDCIQAIWKMVCYTHFPRCNEVQPGNYLRPCASSCHAYVSSCGVECCDEGVRCVFAHHAPRADGSVAVERGYSEHSGPSLLCTGAASSRLGGLVLKMASLALLVLVTRLALS